MRAPVFDRTTLRCRCSLDVRLRLVWRQTPHPRPNHHYQCSPRNHWIAVARLLRERWSSLLWCLPRNHELQRQRPNHPELPSQQPSWSVEACTCLSNLGWRWWHRWHHRLDGLPLSGQARLQARYLYLYHRLCLDHSYHLRDGAQVPPCQQACCSRRKDHRGACWLPIHFVDNHRDTVINEDIIISCCISNAYTIVINCISCLLAN